MSVITNEYDFNKPIKFSFAGFELFKRRFNLLEAEKQGQKVFIDEVENIFCFYVNNSVESVTEGTYAVFDNIKSMVMFKPIEVYKV